MAKKKPTPIEDRLEEVARVFLDVAEDMGGKYTDEDRVNRALALAYCAAKLVEVADKIV